MDKKLLLIFSFCCALRANAQEFVINDSLRLHEVTITGTRLKEFTSGHRIQVVDSSTIAEYRSGNIGELLRKSGALYIHSLGPAGLATCSFRGMNASHTAIIWNGFNLQNIMNGQLDMNLLPVYLLEEVKLQHGGSGALFGSGAVGGAIHLSKNPIYNKGINLTSYLGHGSFGKYQVGKSVEISKKNFISTSKVFFDRAENNFPFRNIAKINRPTERLLNAATEQRYFLQQNQLKITPTDILDFNLWLQNSRRQIPASITARPSDATQDDNAIRISGEYRKEIDHSTLFIRSGFFADQIHFIDPHIGLDADNRSRTVVSEIEFRHRLSPVFALNSGIDFAYNTARTDNYPENLGQKRYSMYGSLKYTHPVYHLNATASLRHSLVDGNPIPLIPSLAAEYGLDNHSTIKANIGMNFRLPTFNDLYWIPLGNPNLVPESGWNQEITYEAKLSIIRTIFSATAYNSSIADLIKWEPDDVGLFRPKNLAEVKSRGIETTFETSARTNNIDIEWNGKYNLVVSTQKSADASADKGYRNLQLMYIPRHRAFTSIRFSKGWAFASYQHQLTGKRFMTTDNDPDYVMPLYHTGDIAAGCHFYIYRSRYAFMGRINNLWNEKYESVAYYPMPGRNYHLSLNIEF
jgi:vitamin B12 transporter